MRPKGIALLKRLMYVLPYLQGTTAMPQEKKFKEDDEQQEEVEGLSCSWGAASMAFLMACHRKVQGKIDFVHPWKSKVYDVFWGVPEASTQRYQGFKFQLPILVHINNLMCP